MATVLLLICESLFVWVNPAYAYLDPSSGSVMLQIVLGGIAGLAVIVRLYWHQLLTFLGVRKEKETPSEVDDLSSNVKPEENDG